MSFKNFYNVSMNLPRQVGKGVHPGRRENFEKRVRAPFRQRVIQSLPTSRGRRWDVVDRHKIYKDYSTHVRQFNSSRMPVQALKRDMKGKLLSLGKRPFLPR
ncbi:hypothetical protein TRVL_08864 [Trypanosoma vivax]|uniref:Uncharacterized protein n=1 Tax=Trypanosoma vivax (strain Y486) TaxID=1055687 RepID=G0U176_TRYVY|nr:hypothetical protein TRVL_08864 [Trypanosoma vivax]CCC49831.1 hypothetical protein TVY486_0804390 [Trypanosoma vivax Y486]